MALFESDYPQQWNEYYALRNRARLSLLAMAVCLYLLVVKPPNALLDKLNSLPDPIKLTVVLVGIGVATIVLAVPLLRWAEWKCPGCGNKFVQPGFEFGILTVVTYIAWRLVSGWHCAICKLPCGAHLEHANFDNHQP